ncbi:MAG: ABC transporter substrate-binding protein [Gammaproteobacteria bacterium SG8_31]|jgi:arabinogalactan oligomer/maltooligosaccharide transport system substrate-binding protein|nr:MAG: ABC transporter substrate-binding protein [Gammaproteobacteria bacterium SG8_31]
MNTRSLVTKSLWACCLTTLLGWTAASAADLVVWHAYRGAERAAFEKVVSNFNASQGDIKVKTLPVPYDAYADKITAAIPRGRGPDVFIFAQDRLGGWVEGGQTVESIDFYLEDGTVDALLPGLMEAMSYRDTVYGLPIAYKSPALVYNKAMIETPPTTTTELVTMAKKFTAAAGGRYGLVYEYSNFYFHSALMNAFGGRVFDPEGPTPTLDDPRIVASINLMMKWFREDGIVPADPSSTLVTALFNDGKTPMVFNGPWFISEVEGVDVGVAAMPTVEEAGGEPMKPWLTVEGIYVSAQSDHKEAAYEFARYVATDDESAFIRAVEGRQLPSHAGVYERPEVAGDPILSGFRAQYNNSVPMPNYAEMTLMWSPVTTAMNKITKGAASPEAGLGAAQKELEASIAALRTGR